VPVGKGPGAYQRAGCNLGDRRTSADYFMRYQPRKLRCNGTLLRQRATPPRQRKHFECVEHRHDFTDERRATRACARSAEGLGEEGIWLSNCRFTWTIT